MNWFRQIPFLRILIPFLLGILLAFSFGELHRIHALYFLLAFLFLLGVYFVSRRYSIKYWIIAADLFLMLFAYSLVQLKNPFLDPRHYTSVYKPGIPLQLIGRCEDVPAEKKKSVKIPLTIFELRQEGRSYSVKGKVLVYIRKHSFMESLKAAQWIYLEGKLNEVELNGNPGEFDYKQHLRNKQVYHILFADSTSYQILPSENRLSIYSLALKCKQIVVDRLDQSGLSAEARGICAALLTGFDEEIGDEIVQSFSHSGTLHVLSVSGLHAGLIYAFLNFIFNLFDRYRRQKILRFTLIVSAMWSFAFVCGLEAPILRAVIMLTFIGIGELLFNSSRNSRLNILFLAAFVLLCSDPYLLKDIGFQLSFSAILGLICIEPLLNARAENKNPLLRWLWQGTSASFAATLFTLPFTLYYFKQFPYWFFLANLVVVPAAFLLMFLSIGALLNLGWMVVFINTFTKVLIEFIHLFDSDTFAYARGLNFRLEDALWMTLFFLLVWTSVQNRSYRLLIMSLFSLIFWQVHANINLYRDLHSKQICIYNIKGASAALIKDGNGCYYQSSNPDMFARILEAHLSVLGQPEARGIKFNAVVWKNAQMLLLDSSNYIPEFDSQKASIWVLSNNYQLSEKVIRRLGQPKQVLSDGSNSYIQNKKNEQLCRKFAFSYHSLRKQGARLITRNEIENW